MSRRIIALIVVFLMLVCMASCGKEEKLSFTENRAIKKINNALEMSFELKNASIKTDILEGSYSPEDGLRNIEADFNVEEPTKDKNARNIEFDILFTYADRQESVRNLTNYEGIYLNVYYPYPKYNKIYAKTVQSVKVNKVDSSKEYIVSYKDTHLSRRVEWEYCKVEDDYETFLINEDGVITEYESVTLFKQKTDNNLDWVDGKSQLNVKLKSYTLLD